MPTARVVEDEWDGNRVWYMRCSACNGLKHGDHTDEFAVTAQMVEHNERVHGGAQFEMQDRPLW